MAMLRVYDNVQDAMQVSTRMRLPLLVVLYARCERHGSVAQSNNSNDNEEQQVHDDHNNSSGDDGASGAARAQSQLHLSHDDKLGNIVGGDAQRAALEQVLRAGRFDQVAVLHLLEEGTPQYSSFVSLSASSGPPSLPCVHVFAPALYTWRPAVHSVLHGRLLTPSALYAVVTATLQLPLVKQMQLPTHSIMTASDTAVTAAAAGDSNNNNSNSAALRQLQELLSTTTDAMNREHKRAQQQQQQQVTQALTAVATAASTSGSGSAAAMHTTTASTTAAPAAATTTARQGAAVGGGGGGAHVVRIDGLPSGKRRVVMTSATMRLSTVWHDVRLQLQRAVAAMREGGVRDNTTAPLRTDAAEHFVLRIDDAMRNADDNNRQQQQQQQNDDEEEADGARGSSDGAVVVRSVAEAEQVLLQSLPSGTLIHVCIAPVQHAVPAAKTTTRTAPPPQQQQQQQQAATATAAAKADVTDTTQTSPTTSTTSTTAAAVPSGRITLRCTLPSGATETFANLDSATATLHREVRPHITRVLGHDRFVFVRAYPPRRYDVYADEVQPLQAIGLTSSSTLRVVPTDDAPPPPPRPSAMSWLRRGNSSAHTVTAAGASVSGDSSGSGSGGDGSEPYMDPNSATAASGHNLRQLADMLRRFMSTAMPATASGGSGGNADGGGGGNASSSASGSAGRMRTMAELVAERDAADERDAAEMLRRSAVSDPAAAAKKSAHYFGGDSTEYVAHGGDGDSAGPQHGEGHAGDAHDDDNDDERRRDGTTTTFAGAGRRLVYAEERSGAGEGAGTAPDAPAAAARAAAAAALQRRRAQAAQSSNVDDDNNGDCAATSREQQSQ